MKWDKYKEKTLAPHKVICDCGYYNDPSKLRRTGSNKSCKCIKCGRDLKSKRDEFKDTLLRLLKEEIN